MSYTRQIKRMMKSFKKVRTINDVENFIINFKSKRIVNKRLWAKAWAKLARIYTKRSKYQKIVKRYPYMFQHEVTGSWDMPFALFGFECGKGWYDIIANLCEQIDKSLTEEEKKTFRVDQIKEKYGTLRFYINGGSDKIFDYIDEAEKMSEITCESCGKEGKLYERFGWWRVRCEKCREKLEKE